MQAAAAILKGHFPGRGKCPFFGYTYYIEETQSSALAENLNILLGQALEPGF